MKAPSPHDCIIIGAGLSGLITGISLQKKGFNTIILDKRVVAGGLCGTFKLEGHEFVIGCNDFGESIQRTFKELGIPQEFTPSKMKFHFDFGDIALPSAGAILKLLKYTPDIIRLIRTAKGVQKGRYPYTYYSELTNHVKNEKFKDIVDSMVYAAGTPSSKLRLKDMSASLFDKELNYGYNSTVIPVGGPGAMVKNMTSYYRKLGGTIQLNTLVTGIDKNEEGHHIISTENGDQFSGKALISSVGRLEEYPEEFQPGMKLAMLHLSVNKRIKYPEKYHTLAFLPKNIEEWFQNLHQGTLPNEFGFHLFKSDLKNEGDCNSISIYHFVPRGVETLSKDQKESIKQYLFSKIETILPGFKEAVEFEKYLDPNEFTEMHDGLSSAVFARIIEGDYEKPEIYCPERDIHFTGNSVNPPGEHACGAVLSGIRASDMVEEKLQAV